MVIVWKIDLFGPARDPINALRHHATVAISFYVKHRSKHGHYFLRVGQPDRVLGGGSEQDEHKRRSRQGLSAGPFGTFTRYLS